MLDMTHADRNGYKNTNICRQFFQWILGVKIKKKHLGYIYITHIGGDLISQPVYRFGNLVKAQLQRADDEAQCRQQCSYTDGNWLEQFYDMAQDRNYLVCLFKNNLGP